MDFQIITGSYTQLLRVSNSCVINPHARQTSLLFLDGSDPKDVGSSSKHQ